MELNPDKPGLEDIKKDLDNILSIFDPNELLNFVFSRILLYPNSSSFDEQKYIIERMISAAANIDQVFSRIDSWTFREFPDELLKFLMDSDMSGGVALRFCLESKKYDFLNEHLKEMLSKGADIDQIFDESWIFSDLSDELLKFLMDSGMSGGVALRVCFEQGKYDFIKEYSLFRYLDENKREDLSMIADTLFDRFNVENAVSFFSVFPNTNLEAIRTYAESTGASRAIINVLFDFVYFVKEFIENGYAFSEAELNLLGKKTNEFTKENFNRLRLKDVHESLPLSVYMDNNVVNKYFDILCIAIIGGHYSLASALIEEGIEITPKSSLLIARCLDNEETGEIISLGKILLDHVDSVDESFDENGETLIDQFLNIEQLLPYALNKTKDISYTFLKKEAHCDAMSLNNSKANVVITHGEDFWSVGAISTGRVAMKYNAELQVFMLNSETIDRCGAVLLDSIDGFINPGAGDSFPDDKEEFSSQDMKTLSRTEKAYQKIIGVALAENVPYFGMCAGAQNFILKNDGYLFPLSGYDSGTHAVTLEDTSMVHFVSMYEAEQRNALEHCEFPKISYMADTAHHYAAVLNKLGNNINLGGTSEDNVAMAYSHKNGIHFATQYHPEHKYAMNDNNRQKLLLNNFFDLAIKHRDARGSSEESVHGFMQDIQDKLRSCEGRISKIEYDDYSVFVDEIIFNDELGMQTVVIGDFLKAF